MSGGRVLAGIRRGSGGAIAPSIIVRLVFVLSVAVRLVALAFRVSVLVSPSGFVSSLVFVPPAGGVTAPFAGAPALAVGASIAPGSSTGRPDPAGLAGAEPECPVAGASVGGAPVAGRSVAGALACRARGVVPAAFVDGVVDEESVPGAATFGVPGLVLVSPDLDDVGLADAGLEVLDLVGRRLVVPDCGALDVAAAADVLSVGVAVPSGSLASADAVVPGAATALWACAEPGVASD